VEAAPPLCEAARHSRNNPRRVEASLDRAWCHVGPVPAGRELRKAEEAVMRTRFAAQLAQSM
jgi:hypothetical protein